MPHECTTCGRTFSDGSKEMLSGCPGCGGNKFQFRPKGASTQPEPEPEPTGVSAAEPDASGISADSDASSHTPADTETRTSTGADSRSSTDTGMQFGAPAKPEGPEDGAQADARSGMVGRDELPDAPVSEPDEDEPEESGLERLREELNEQFESIKIVEPGQYELNLMGLYDREEYIIALQENGRYVINVPDSWRD